MVRFGVLTKTSPVGCFLLLVCALLSACSPCDYEKASEAVSPSHQLTATVVRVGCGAVAKDATWVTLHRTGEKYDRADDLVLSVVQQQQIQIAWTDDSHLSIDCRCGDNDVRLRVTKKGGVTITYK